MADENDKIDGAAGAGDNKGKDTPVDRGDEVKSPLDDAGKPSKETAAGAPRLLARAASGGLEVLVQEAVPGMSLARL